MNINIKQVLALAIALLGAVIASTAQLTDLFGQGNAKIIISVASMLNSLLGVTMSVISSQTGLVSDVQAMPGVEKIVVNDKANPTLASLAVDPKMLKIEPKPGDESAVRATAAK